MKELLPILVLSLSAVASVAASLTVCVSLLQVVKTQKIAKIELFRGFRQDFGQTRMNEALFELYAWKEKYGNGFASEWLKKFRAQDEAAVKVNHHRRLVNTYVFDLVTAYEAKALTRVLAKRASTNSLYEVYNDICMPMHSELYGPQRKREKNISSTFLKIRRTRDKF